VEGNTVNGKPLVYLENTSDYKVEDAGQVILVNCNNISVENRDLSNTGIGIELWKTEDSKVLNNTVSNNDDGIAIDSYAMYPPITAKDPMRNILITRVATLLDTDSSDVTMSIMAEDSVQKALASSTVRVSRDVIAGRTRVMNRIGGNAVAIKLSNNTLDETWAIENMMIDTAPKGKTRKNQI